MTWNRQDDRYLLKFRLNLHQKVRGIPTGEDLDSEFLQDKSIPITKKNVLSVACQFYDPNGLAAPLMFPVRALFSEVCRDRQCSMQTPLSAERADRFRTAVEEILKTTQLSFPRQIVFKYSGKLRIFFDGSLQGYGACIYMESHGQFNILISSAKIMGKAAYTAPQSEIASAVLAVKMERKINLELSNVTLTEPMFIGDSEIVLKMIARDDPAGLPIFYGTRIMEISALSATANWNWCPGALNPADLLTRTGSTLEKVNSKFWLQGSFLPQPRSSWPIKNCVSLISDQTPSIMIKKVSANPPNPLTEYVTELLTRCRSYSKVLAAFCILLKIGRSHSKSPENLLPWNRTRNIIVSNIINCFNSSAEGYIAKNKLKHLLVRPQDGIYYVSDRSFRSRIGVPLICGKTVLANCIVQDAHDKLGHGRDVLQILSIIQAEFYIPGARKLVLRLKKSCPGCTN